MKLVTLFAIILTLNACSFSSDKEEVGVHHDDLEFAVDTLADRPDNIEFKVEEQKIAQADETSSETDSSDTGDIPPDQFNIEDETAMAAPEEPKFSDFKKTEPKEVKIAETPTEEPWRTDSAPTWKPEEPVREMAQVQKKKAPKAEIAFNDAPAKIEMDHTEASLNYGQMETYKFQKNDTLMMVAFKIYGDYRKWKDLKKWNKGTVITEGADVKYYVPDQKFGWRPEGQPYLVKTGDTLQIISMDKYKTTRKWKSIYENNRPLIRDPNLIFAGFTIYYRPMRDLASEIK